MKCINCGNELPLNAKFCGVCGVEVKNTYDNNLNTSVTNNPNIDFNESNFLSNQNENLKVTNSLESTNTIENNFDNINLSSQASNVAPEFESNNGSDLKVQNSADFNGLTDNLNNISVPSENNNFTDLDNNLNQGTDSNFNNSVGPAIKPLDETNINSQNSVNANFSNNINNDVSTINNKKSKNKVLPIVIIGIIFVLAIACVVGFLFLNKKNSPKEIFLDEFRNVTSKLLVNTNEKDYYNEISFNTNLKADELGYTDIINLINKLKFTYSNSYSKASKAMDNTLKVSYDGKDVLNLGAYYRNEKMYLDLGDLYSKSIIVPMEAYNIKNLIEIDTKTKKNLEDIKLSIDSALEKAMKSNYFKSSKETITVDGKSRKVTANTMNLSGKDFNAFMNDLFADLKNNDKFIGAIAEMSGIEKNTIKESLNIENEQLNIDETLSFTIYTSGFLKKSYEGINLKIVSSGTEISMNILKANENKYNISITTSGVTISGTLTKEIVNDTTKYSFKMNLGTNSIGADFSIKKQNKANLKTIDENNTITMEEFETTGMLEVTTNIQKNETLLKLYEEIDRAISGNTSSSQYSNNYSLDSYNTDYESLLNSYDNL